MNIWDMNGKTVRHVLGQGWAVMVGDDRLMICGSVGEALAAARE